MIGSSVKVDGDGEQNDICIWGSRLFSNTDDRLKGLFALDKGPYDTNNSNFKGLEQLPCLFTDEIHGYPSFFCAGRSHARTGKIFNIRTTNTSRYRTDWLFDCLLDNIYLDHTILCNEKRKLGIPYEHLCSISGDIINKDLFKILYELNQLKSPICSDWSPFTFNEPNKPLEKKIAVMMPFSDSLRDVYCAIKEVAGATGYTCTRADEIWHKPDIVQDIINLIDTSEIVICVCTGGNANVFYEMGIAHTLGRKVIPIADNIDDIPFDTKTKRHLLYTSSGDGLAKLREELKQLINKIENQ